jgi:hypothetical protein
MGITSIDLYRRGNSSSPRMDNVRPVDVASFIRNGAEWVGGRSGGISTFASPTPPGRGRIWRLPAGTLYSDELHLENDHGDHWSWGPARDMKMARYRAFLAAVGQNFV